MWILLVVIAQFTWAMGNFLDRYLLDKFRLHDTDETVRVGALVTFSALFSCYIWVAVLAAAAYLFGTPPLTLLLSVSVHERLLAFTVGVLEIVWLIPYLHALADNDETIVGTLFQLVPLFGFVFGIVFFAEYPSPVEIAAGAAILFGALLLTLKPKRQQEEQRIWSRRFDVRTFTLMALASAIVALAAFIFKEASGDTLYWASVAWMTMGSFFSGVLLLLVPSYRMSFLYLLRRAPRRYVLVNVLNEVFDNAAILAFYGAILLGPATALVQATTAYQPVFLLLIGGVAALLGSTRHKAALTCYGLLRRLAAMLLLVVGSYYIVLL